jgi:hypothetical protein
VFHYSTGTLVWLSKKQKVVSLLNTKEKYHGVVQVSTEVIWIHQLLGELGIHVHTSTIIYCDNHSAIQVAENPIVHSKMKHVELHSHYLRWFMRTLSHLNIARQNIRFLISSPNL